MQKLISSLTSNVIRVILFLILTILVFFLIRNWGQLTMPIKLTLINSIEYPLIYWIGITFVSGCLALFFFNYPVKRKLKRRLKEAEKQNKEYLSELAKLRNLSLTDDMKSMETIQPPDSEPTT